MSDTQEEALQVPDLVKEYGITTFIETGCYEGSTLGFALGLGLKAYSCDINEKFVDNCKEKYPEATIHLGESVAFFKEWLPKIEDRSWFWLDAHHPNNYGKPQLFTMENYFPAFEELKLIKELKSNYEKDIIIIDDVNTIEASDNPMCNPKEVPPQIITAKGHLLQEYKDMFKETHNVKVLSNGCGILVYTPINK